jgi:hypothetical protein
VKLSTENDVEFFDALSVPFGISFGQWTVRWWKWAFSSPAAINPVVDPTGRYASVNQPSSDVWFLAGKFGSADKVFPSRICVIPANRSILFPVLNCEANMLEYPDLESHQDLISHVRSDVDSVVKKECFLNDVMIKPQRVSSDPLIFEITIKKDNPLRIKRFGNANACGDGYWVFLKGLRRGNHRLRFEGSCENGALSAGAIYALTIK